ncbi:MAG: hypothetical protein IJS40_03855 [Synergistaceae bacterium]|nr:hypothetical protein [Synergistaceae bacterium]
MEKEPSKKNFREDSWQRAREITSPKPLPPALMMSSNNNIPGNRRTRRYRQNFTTEERIAILSRVREVGVLKAAIEFNADKHVIMKWIKAVNTVDKWQKTHEDIPQQAKQVSDKQEQAQQTSIPFEEPEENHVELVKSEPVVDAEPEISLPVEQVEEPEPVTAEIKEEAKIQELAQEEIHKAKTENRKEKAPTFVKKQKLKIAAPVQKTHKVPRSRVVKNENENLLEVVEPLYFSNGTSDLDLKLKIENTILKDKLQAVITQVENLKAVIAGFM